MIKSILSLLGIKKNYKIQSFTYYIPSPPARSSGYREKQFDKLFYELINRGYRIIDLKTQASSGDKQSGMWLIFILEAQNGNAELLNLEEIINNSTNSKETVKESIEGFYYIDDRSQENE